MRKILKIGGKKAGFLLLIFFCFLPVLSAQHYYRIRADFSFKYTGGAQGGQSLVMGTAFFDKVEQKITYQVRFPKKQVWVMKDTVMYKYENDRLIERSYVPSPVAASIFNLALQSSMNNFALEDSPYTLSNVEEDKGLVIATWTPPKIPGNDQIGDVLIANQDGRLTGIVFQDAEGRVVSKQFFEEYAQYGGIWFPGQVTQILYLEKGEAYQVTNYKNIILDENGNDHWYRYPVP